MKTVKFQGLNIRIENEAGSVRKGKDKDGKPWSTTMAYPYGEIIGSMGVDGDPVDVFIGPDKGAKFAYVVHQSKKDGLGFDEDKCMLGFSDVMAAKNAYFKGYDIPEFFWTGDVSVIPMDEFKKKVLQTKKNPAMIRAAKSNPFKIGDPVTVDGMHGRGVVTAIDGRRVTIKFRNLVYMSRDFIYVHSMTEGNYKSRYQTPMRASGMKLATAVALHGAHESADDTLTHDAYKNVMWAVDDETGEILPFDNPKVQKQRKKYREIFHEYHKNNVVGGIVVNAADETIPDRITEPNKRIEQVGTQFCIRTDGVDKNLGCWPSKEKAEAVMSGKSFIEPDLPKNLLAGGPGSGRKRTKPKGLNKWKSQDEEIKQARKDPNQMALPLKAESMEYGEPLAGALQHAHLDTNLWFHPPSLKNPTKVPADNPGEKDNRFGDVDKRKSKETQKQRMDLLKKSAPGGLPAQIPVRTTLVSPVLPMYSPLYASRARQRRRVGGGSFRAYGAARI